MSKLSSVTLHLLGAFAVEANVGRSIAIAIRAKKGRALLAYLAMRPGYQARREELATLLWGDNPDMLARHSLRQCLISLRQDLSAAAEILVVDRETIGLDAQRVAVDACSFMALAQAGGAEAGEAAQLWRGAFLPDFVLDIEEFDAWRNREADRLSAAAAGVFDTLCRSADAANNGESALAAVERLIALDPTREDRQRTALRLLARYSGRDAALSHAKLLTDLLRSELDVSPEPATRALIEEIRKTKSAAATPPDQQQSVVVPVVEPVATPPLAPREAEAPADASPAVADARQGQQATEPYRPSWQRRPLAAALLGVAAVAVAVAAVLGLARPTSLAWLIAGAPRNQAVVVLPFAAEDPARPDDPALARLLTHDLIGYLSRFGNVRVISEPKAESYRDRQADTSLTTDLGVQYAIVGHVQDAGSDLKIDFQLVDAASQTNIWSDALQRPRGDPTLVADEMARGIARALSIEFYHLSMAGMGTKPNSQLTVPQLVARGYLLMERGHTRQSLTSAVRAFKDALQRNPHYEPALLGLARVQIIAVMNYVELNPAPDLAAAERTLTATLDRFPNSISALYSLALLQKYHRQYDASMRYLRRCLELNPSFLSAQAQLGDILIRTGQPQQGLEKILQTIHASTSNDPAIGYWYLFAAEAELELGKDQAALDWALRADTFMPDAPLVNVWLASIYANIGDRPHAAQYAAVLRKIAPARMQSVLNQSGGGAAANGGRGLRIFTGLRLALNAPPI